MRSSDSRNGPTWSSRTSRRGRWTSWGLGYDVVAERNPRVVYAASSAFGTEGTDAAREGADLSGQAAGGLISTTGRDGGELTPVAVTIADHIASQNLVAGILAALLARERTGRGQRVTTSLLGGQIWAQASEFTGCMLRGAVSRTSQPGTSADPRSVRPLQDGRRLDRDRRRRRAACARRSSRSSDGPISTSDFPGSSTGTPTRPSCSRYSTRRSPPRRPRCGASGSTLRACVMRRCEITPRSSPIPTCGPTAI